MAICFVQIFLIVAGYAAGELAKSKNGVQSVLSPEPVKKENTKVQVNDERKKILESLDESLPYPKAKSVLFEEVNGHRMAEITWVEHLGEFKMVDCRLFGNKSLIHKLLKDAPQVQIRLIERNEMNKLIGKCTILQLSSEYNETPRPFVEFKALDRTVFDSVVIYPGTKWCGPGNVADGYDDLGPFAATDICCRAHDHCNDTIRGFNKKYGLTNKAPFTKSHCDCDDAFTKCLLDSNTKTSNTVGSVYFNTFQIQCFKNEHPIVKCVSHKGLPYLFWSCQKYILDTKRPLKWQFFDAKYYVTSDD